MTIASEIARLQGVKSDILGAIAEKKVDVPAGAMLADAPDLIRSIKSGINVKIGQGVYPAVKIGNQLWLARNLDEELGTLGVDEWYYNGRSEKTRLNKTVERNLKVGYTGDVYLDLDAKDSSERKIMCDFVAGKKLQVSAKITINKAVETDINCEFYVVYTNSNGDTSYAGFSQKLPTGETSLDFKSFFGTARTTAFKNFPWTNSFFFRIGGGEAKSYSIAITDVVVNVGETNSSSSAVGFSQALANEETAKANNYGRLYTWNNLNENLSKLGLTKWRWPTKADFEGLVAIDSTGKKFRTKSWNGTDDFGFSAVPSGDYENGFIYGNVRSYFAISNYVAGEWIHNAIIFADAFSSGSSRKSYGISLRLVLDLNEDGTIPDSNIVLEDVPATTAEPLALASEPIVTEEEAE